MIPSPKLRNESANKLSSIVVLKCIVLKRIMRSAWCQILLNWPTKLIITVNLNHSPLIHQEVHHIIQDLLK